MTEGYNVSCDGAGLHSVYPSYTEFTTILKGRVYYGEGRKFDTSSPKTGEVSTFAIVPANQAHFVWTRDEEAVVQFQFEGPSSTIFVDSVLR